MTYRLTYDPDSLPTREAMRTPHKTRHTAARFTTRNGRRPAHGAELGR